MKRLTVLLLVLFSAGCMNKLQVPDKIEACIQDPETKKCTNQAVVKHIITLELPTILTDTCKAAWSEAAYPDQQTREAGYNKCVSDYISSILALINDIRPEELPTPK